MNSFEIGAKVKVIRMSKDDIEEYEKLYIGDIGVITMIHVFKDGVYLRVTFDKPVRTIFGPMDITFENVAILEAEKFEKVEGEII